MARTDANILADQKTGSVNPYVPLEYYTVGRPSDGGGEWTRFDNLSSTQHVISIDHKEKPYGIKATIVLDNADSAYDSYDLKNLWIRIGYGTDSDVSYPAYLKVKGQGFGSSPNAPRDRYIIKAYGGYNLLAGYTNPTDLHYNQPNADATLTSKSAKDILDDILEDAGLDLGTSISEDTVIDVWEPVMDFYAGENGMQMVLKVLAIFKCSLLSRIDEMVLLSVNTGDSVTYKCPYDASYQSFTDSELLESLWNPMKVVVKDPTGTYEGEYADANWDADSMGYYYWVDRYAVVDSNADCVLIATAEVTRQAQKDKLGIATLPIMDCLSEIYDTVTITDGRGNTSGSGLIGGIHRYYEPGHKDSEKRFWCEMILGDMYSGATASVQQYVGSGSIVNNIYTNIITKVYDVCRYGATFPTAPDDGTLFRHQVTGRDILYQYDSTTTSWKPIIAYGAMTVYVDKTDGTDDLDHGTGVDSDAFATIGYAIAAIPGLIDGNVSIYLNGEDYSGEGTLYIKGKQPVGNHAIYIYGTLSTSSSGTQSANGTKGTGATQGAFTDAGNLAGVANKLCYLDADGDYRIIDSTDGNTATIVGGFTSQPLQNENYVIYDWATTMPSLIVYSVSAVLVYDVKFDGVLHSYSSSGVTAYRCYASSSDVVFRAATAASLYLYYCYGIGDTVNRSCGVLSLGHLQLEYTKIGTANANSLGIYSNGGHITLTTGSIYDGAVAGGGNSNYGFYIEGNSGLSLYSASIYGQIKNCDVGLYASTSSGVDRLDRVNFSGNTLDTRICFGGVADYISLMEVDVAALPFTAAAGYGYIVIDDSAPSELWFVDDAGGTEQISTSFMLFVWDKVTRQFLKYYRIRTMADFYEDNGILHIYNKTEDLSLVEYKLYPKQSFTPLYEDVLVGDTYEKRIAWQTIDSLNLLDFTENELPCSEHIGKLVAVNPSLAKPATIRRSFMGVDYDIKCVVTQSVKDQFQSGALKVNDYVLVSFIEEIPNGIERNIAVVTDKIYKSW
ncbi:hypothetical protein ACFLXA_02870 [Chloroflexota bacterium]